MKRILITTNIILLCAVVVMGYILYRIDSVQTDIDTNTIGNPKSCVSKICRDYSNVPWTGRINYSVAKMLADNYKADKGKYFIWNRDEVTKTEDARSAWFPLEVLKRYIWEIDKRNCEKGCSDSLGLRIYYARYPDQSNSLWTESGLELMTGYANHHTLFMVPTYWDKENAIHRDFDPWGLKCRAPIDKNSGRSNVNGFIFLIGGDDDSQNHGSLIPPDAQAGSDFIE